MKRHPLSPPLFPYTTLFRSEQTRQHFVTTFIENLGGVDFENRRVMTIRDRYEAAVPVVVEAVTRKQAVFVEDAAFLRQHTDAPIKWALPGQIGRAHV